jgi:transcriptional regulator with XRE-family HTH domain
MLGRRIQDLRERQGISRETLAERTGLRVEEVIRLETHNHGAQVPTDVLLRIADGLRLRKAIEFASLVRLNGMTRRFQAYCLGLAKTGTVSIGGIFSNYRNGHEFQQWETHQMIIQYRRQQISRQEFKIFLQDRDAVGCLEMDTAHFNRHYVDILAQEYPEAKFVCLIRDCYSWVNSKLNYFIIPEREALQSQELPNGFPFDLPRGACEAKEELICNFDRYIDIPLTFWAAEYRAMIARLPRERSLIVRTHDIANQVETMAHLVGVPPETLVKERSHLNKGQYRLNIFDRYDHNWLQQKFDTHCGELMSTYFPGYTLQDFLNGNPIPALPNTGGAY